MRVIQFVVKVSKFCNLRCKYCYEFEELGRQESMSREDLRRMYTHIRDYYAERDLADGKRTEIKFIWHGGEPLLLRPSYYWDTFKDQGEIFGDQLAVTNLVQTNLTKLDQERIALLRDGFDDVGVSVDLFGGLRVNAGGQDSQDKVLRNMQVLREAGVNFAAITVLSGANIAHVESIFRFYEKTKVPFRILPLFPGAWEGQVASFELTSGQVTTALKRMVDLWLESPNTVSITPLVRDVKTVMRYLAKDSPRYFNKRSWTPTVLVDTSGDCYSYGDPYQDRNWTLGNLFRSPLRDIIEGPAFDKSARAAEERMAANCMKCKYFGACDGYPIAEDGGSYRELTPENVRRCVVERDVLEHIERRLRATGLVHSQQFLATQLEQGQPSEPRSELA